VTGVQTCALPIFLIGDTLKILLAAGLLPAAWWVTDKIRR